MGQRIALVVPGLGGIAKGEGVQGVVILSCVNQSESAPDRVLKFFGGSLIVALLKVVAALLVVGQPEV